MLQLHGNFPAVCHVDTTVTVMLRRQSVVALLMSAWPLLFPVS